MYILASIGFVFLGLVEFAFVIVINRTSFGTQEKLENPKVTTVRKQVTFKIGQGNRERRITNKIRSLRYAMKKGAYEANSLENTDKVKTPTTIVRKTCMRSLQSVDIIACCVFLCLFVSFNCFYFFYYLSSHEICQIISNA